MSEFRAAMPAHLPRHVVLKQMKAQRVMKDGMSDFVQKLYDAPALPSKPKEEAWETTGKKKKAKAQAPSRGYGASRNSGASGGRGNRGGDSRGDRRGPRNNITQVTTIDRSIQARSKLPERRRRIPKTHNEDHRNCFLYGHR